MLRKCAPLWRRQKQLQVKSALMRRVLIRTTPCFLIVSKSNRDLRSLSFTSGFTVSHAKLQDGLIVIVSRLAVEAQKESLLQYLKRIGPLPEPTELLPCTLRGEVDVVIADIIGASQHRSAVAEITFHAFSWKTIVDKVRETSTEPILATCTALLRCDPDLQKQG